MTVPASELAEALAARQRAVPHPRPAPPDRYPARRAAARPRRRVKPARFAGRKVAIMRNGGNISSAQPSALEAAAGAPAGAGREGGQS